MSNEHPQDKTPGSGQLIAAGGQKKTSIRGAFLFVIVGLRGLINYLYLTRVSLVGLLLLGFLPIAALGPARALVIGAYDLDSTAEAFFTGLALCALGASIFLTARVTWELAEIRYQLRLDRFLRTIETVWRWAVILSLLLNVGVILCVSSQGKLFPLVAGLFLAAVVGAWVAWQIIVRRPMLGQGWLRGLILKAMKWVGLGKESGYLILDSDDRPTDIQPGHASVIIFAFVLLVFYVVAVHFSIPALVTVLVVIAMVVLFFAGGTFYLDRYRVPLLLVVLAYCGLMACWWQNDHYYRVWPAPVSTVAPEDFTPRAVIRKAMDEQRPIVVVASAGGGIQSAAWTTATLRRIDEELRAAGGGQSPDFPGSVRLMSGVSGGSVGSLFYAMAVPLKEGDRFTKADVAAGKSGLGQAMRGLLRDDLVRALAPFTIFNGKRVFMDIYQDRGHELEQAWVQNANDEFQGASGLAEATLSQWGKDALALERPALIFNSTLVETGERLAISTVPTSPEHAKGSIGSCEFLHRYRADLPMTTAARLSATFPFISPTARPGPSKNAKEPGSSLPGPEFWGIFPRGGNYLHCVDGGYYENSGVVGAVEWLDNAFTEMVARGDKLPPKILFIELNAFPETEEIDRTKFSPGDAPAIDEGMKSRGTLYDLISPVPAIVNVRGSGQKAFATLLFEMFRARWVRQPGNSVNIETVRIFYDVDPVLRDKPIKTSGLSVGPDPKSQPLSWHLRPCEIEDINEHLKNLGTTKEFTKIKEFFRP